MKESTDAMTKGISTALMEISHVLTDEIRNGFKDVKKEWNRETVNVENGTVYGFYFVKRVFSVMNANSMLVLAVAKNDIEAIDKAKGIMARSGYNAGDWDVTISTKLEIVIDRRTPTAMPPPIEGKSIDTYISNLLYAKDKFTDTPHEKAVITKIINKINQNHARNTFRQDIK
jgi:hypothetical protein